MILPTPTDVREARTEIGFTQARAARLVGASTSAWRKWETSWESDEYRQISAGMWELFLRRTDERRPKGSRFKLRPSLRKPPK